MIVSGRKIASPGTSELRFDSLLDSLREEAHRAKSVERDYLLDLIDRCAVLDAKKGVSKASLKKNAALVSELMRRIVPPALTRNEIKGVSAPWDTEFFYTSERMAAILDKAGADYQVGFENISDDDIFVAACMYIMAAYYGYPSQPFKPFYFSIPNADNGKMHYYRQATNVDHISIRPTSKAKEITKEVYKRLIDNYTDVMLWKEYFPIGSWIFSGFSISNLMDLTADQMLSDLTEHLLSGAVDPNWNMAHDISNVMGIEVELSFIHMNGEELTQNKGRDLQALILGDRETVMAQDYLSAQMYKVLIKDRQHFVVPNVETFAAEYNCPAMSQMAGTGIESYYAVTVEHEGTVYGIMELGSKKKGALNAARRVQIDLLMPVISVASKRFLDEHENRIEAIIQSEFTTIHPAVKWRFAEEAEKKIQASFMGAEYEIEQVVFKDVLPLFGQLDIRNSSVIRNEGIKKDLQTQLMAAQKMLMLAHADKPMPLYEEMIHVLEQHNEQLESSMISASEQEIIRFISSEVKPVLSYLSEQSVELKLAYQEYRALLHPEFGFVYRERESFDSAVNTVNKVMSRYIDKKQVEAQAMFPHHFERYATDGLEFNMYIGESIAPGMNFHPMLVKNLRLWQLIVMVEMEREYHQVKQSMNTPLSVAALVLAHSTPLSIQYRMDEKQFDVEGAYNARYEIIKKRIDKANIKGTDIRITEPGQMVVVYSTDTEEQEYLRYYGYLQAKGYLVDTEPEIVTLEDLQGVSGLKAIRCGVQYDLETESSGLTMEEIMSAIEQQD